jgi:undecaprenyl diphosphate synthase
MPEHIAIILDGNRRWAKEKGLDPRLGHSKGAEALENIAKFANKIGLKYMTVYGFSTENWNREEQEIRALMRILMRFLLKFIKSVDSENIRVNVIGDITRFPEKLQAKLIEVMEKTKDNTGTVLNMALNYGGRQEIIRAVKVIARDIKDGKIDIDDIGIDTIESHLYTAGQPDPDIFIRPSGEMRTSNFLPWQLIYTEFIFVKKYWPDFTGEDLLDAIAEFNRRNRRFGGN